MVTTGFQLSFLFPCKFVTMQSFLYALPFNLPSTSSCYPFLFSFLSSLFSVFLPWSIPLLFHFPPCIFHLGLRGFIPFISWLVLDKILGPRRGKQNPSSPEPSQNQFVGLERELNLKKKISNYHFYLHFKWIWWQEKAWFISHFNEASKWCLYAIYFL